MSCDVFMHYKNSGTLHIDRAGPPRGSKMHIEVIFLEILMSRPKTDAGFEISDPKLV